MLRGHRKLSAVRAERLLWLDAFRGIAIGGMIVVNNLGTWRHVYRPLQHAIWSGWTPADRILPPRAALGRWASRRAIEPSASYGAPFRS